MTVIVVPVVLLAMLFVVQFGLAYHARQVLAGAVGDGATAAARQDSGPDAGAALANQMIQDGAGNLLNSYNASGSSDGETVTVTAQGEVVSILPFVGSITVKATRSAKLETFDPQGNAP